VPIMTSSTLHPTSSGFWVRVISKAIILFLAFNLLFILIDPVQSLGNISIYNRLVPGRQRLPYGDNPVRAYNVSLYNLPAMFTSHEIAGGAKPDDEYRVIFIGDSSTWGYLLRPHETLTAYINQQQLTTSDGRRLLAYNLGYPVMSLTKDLLILSQALEYQPDMIVWLVTLESMPRSKQLFPPLLQNNPAAVRPLISTYKLGLDPDDPSFVTENTFQKSLIGQRKPIADWLRLQIYGVMWAATWIDQDIPEQYTLRQEDLSSELNFYDLEPPELPETALALEVLSAGMEMAGEIPVLLINEPMFISQGANSDLRYNFYYPRWAYDAYRDIMLYLAETNDWQYVDLWDRIPPAEFTNSAVHISPTGTRQLSELISAEIINLQEH